jgi:hypothetical protein
LEGYDPGRGSLTAMPEAATWTLMLAAFGALGAVGYETQRSAEPQPLKTGNRGRISFRCGMPITH